MPDHPPQRPDTLRDSAQLVRDLLGVIEYLTHAGMDRECPARFVSINDFVDVSAKVDPVLNRAQAFLVEAEAEASSGWPMQYE